MIHLSIPIQAPGSVEAGSAKESAYVHESSSKQKNRNGFFSRLLEGLTARVKTGDSSPNASSAELDPADSNPADFNPSGFMAGNFKGAAEAKLAWGNLIPAGTAENSLTAGLNAQNSNSEHGFFFEEASELRSVGLRSAELRSAELRSMERSLAELNSAGLGTEELSILLASTEQHSAKRSSAEQRSAETIQGQTGVAGNEKLFSQASSLAEMNLNEKSAEQGLSGKNSTQAELAGHKFPGRTSNAGQGEFQGSSAGFARETDATEPSRYANSELRPDTGNEAGINSRLSELRGRRGRGRSNSVIEVRDLRTEYNNGQNAEAQKNTSFNASKPASAYAELQVNLNTGAKRGDGSQAGKAGSTLPQSFAFEEALAKELRGNLSTDIVRNASIIVRNGGEGTIRLALNPASLGDVKIRLEITDNKITGQIILQSSEALRAFERELPVLEKAFRDSGFSETELSMFLAQDNGNFSNQDKEREFLAQMLAANRYEAELEALSPDMDIMIQNGEDLSFPPGRTPVNLLV